MVVNDETRRERHDLDDAIDRVVRDMTRVETNDYAVARVMARVRGARTSREKFGGFRIWSPGANWSFAATAMLVMIALTTNYFRQATSRGERTTRDEVARATPSAPIVPPAPRTSATAPARPDVATITPHAPAIASAAPRRGGVRPGRAVDTTTHAMSIVEAARAEAAGSETAEEFQSDLSPREGDLAMSGITPAPLTESPALTVEPLGTRELTVDSIDPSPIAVPSPVGPSRGDGDSKGPHTHAS